MSIRGGIDVAVARGTIEGPRRRTGVAEQQGTVNQARVSQLVARMAEGDFQAAAELAAADEEVQPPEPAGIGVLVSLIPVEIIALYTAFVAGSVTMSTPSAEFLTQYKKEHKAAFAHAQTTHLVWIRWSVYGVLALCTIGILYFGWRRARKSTDPRKLPLPEMLAAVVAFGAWGLAMPGGLLAPYVATSDLSFVTLAIATVAAGSLLALGFGTLKGKSGSVPDPVQAGN